MSNQQDEHAMTRGEPVSQNIQASAQFVPGASDVLATDADVLAFLRQHHVMTVGTSSSEGMPWSAAVFFAMDESTLDLYFFSSPRARHSQHVAERPQVAVTIQGQPNDWRAIQGVQIAGECRPAEMGAQYERGLSAYLTRFPFVKDFLGDEPNRFSIGERTVEAIMYRVEPVEVWWVNNRAGFGGREKKEIRRSARK